MVKKKVSLSTTIVPTIADGDYWCTLVRVEKPLQASSYTHPRDQRRKEVKKGGKVYTKAWAVFNPQGRMIVPSVRLLKDHAKSCVATCASSWNGVHRIVGYTCRKVTLVEGWVEK